MNQNDYTPAPGEPEKFVQQRRNALPAPEKEKADNRLALKPCSPSVGDNHAACPTCGHVPDTHRKRQVRHLHVKSEGMVKFIWELQQVLGVTGGFKRMIAEVKILKERVQGDGAPSQDSNEVKYEGVESECIKRSRCGFRAPSPATLRDVLIVLAADMLMTGEMPPDDASDWGFSKSTTLRDKVRVIGYARRSREQCRKWAIRLRAIADSLPNEKSPSAGATETDHE